MLAAAVTGVLAAAVTGVLAAAVTGVLATVVEPAAVEPDGGALVVVAGALLTGVPRLLVELAGAPAVPPPPPHAASVVAMMVKTTMRVTKEGNIRCMVLDNCWVFDCATLCRIPSLRVLTKDRSDPTADNVTSEGPVVKKMAIYKPRSFRNHKPR